MAMAIALQAQNAVWRPRKMAEQIIHAILRKPLMPEPGSFRYGSSTQTREARCIIDYTFKQSAFWNSKTRDNSQLYKRAIIWLG